MLNILRESLKHGAWPKVVLAAVAIGLVAYLGAYFSCDQGARRGGDYAAVVNGEEISIRTFQTQARRLDMNYRQMLGENYEQLKAQIGIGSQAIQALVEERLILQDAAKLGLAVSEDERDEKVRELLTDPATGEYMGKDRGEQMVRRMYGSVPDFMAAVSRTLIMQKWSDLVTAGITVSEDELAEAFRQSTERTAIDFVVVPSSEQETGPALSDEEVLRWYEDHQDDYLRDEGRKIRYVVIERSQQLEGMEVTDEEVRASYEANQASYSHPEQRRARHILFRLEPGTTEDEAQRLLGVAESVHARLQAGEEFAELALAYSQDPGSAQQGGDLGFFARGQMVAEFEAAAFDTPVGELAPVVKSNFGYHVIQVTDERAAGIVPLEDVADEIRRTLELRQAQDRVVSTAQRVRAEIEGSAAFDEVAQAEGLHVESRFVTRNERLVELGASPEFLQTVFDLEPGSVTAPLRVARGMSIVAVDEAVDKAIAPLDEVEDSVRTDLLNERLRQAALASAQRALDRGGDFAAVARRLGKDIAASGDLAPGQGLPGTGGSTPEMQESLFAPGLMEGDRGAVRVPAGALVYEVTRHEPFDAVAFEAGKAELRRELIERRRFELRQSILDQMARVLEIEINGDLVEAYNG